MHSSTTVYHEIHTSEHRKYMKKKPETCYIVYIADALLFNICIRTMHHLGTMLTYAASLSTRASLSQLEKLHFKTVFHQLI